MRNLKVGLLGPDGTFTAEAGFNYCVRKKIKPEVLWAEDILSCFKALEEEKAEIAIVPILNSTVEASWINTTLNKLRNCSSLIYGEYVLEIKHNLLASRGTNLECITQVCSKDKAIEQCKAWLGRYLPHVTVCYENSTAAAARKVSEIGERTLAAIAPIRAAQLYGLEVLAEGIQDLKNNKTRFIVLGKEDHEVTGNDKTSLIFEFDDVKRYGLLNRVFREFSKRQISLGYIQSMPFNGALNQFTFYCDIEGHRKSPNVREALEVLDKDRKRLSISYMKILGSYPAHCF